MNCPLHVLVYAAEPRLSRDLPFRLAELGTMFRFERSGVVGGLSRRRDGPKYAGDPGSWARSEAMIRSALTGLGLRYQEAQGEAAFYGPKWSGS